MAEHIGALLVHKDLGNRQLSLDNKKEFLEAMDGAREIGSRKLSRDVALDNGGVAVVAKAGAERQ